MLRFLLDWLDRHPLLLDGLITLLASPLALLQIAVVADRLHAWWGYVLVLGLGWGALYVAPLLLRRRNPELMGWLVVLAHLIQLLCVPLFTPGNLVLPLVFYALAAYAPARRSRWWLYGGIAASVAGAARWAVRWDGTNGGSAVVVAFGFLLVGCLGVVAASWFMGALARASRQNVQALRDRAAALEGEQEQSAKLALIEERARIAREMHDVVAHSLSLIVVQTDGAAYVAALDGDPAAQLATTRASLETIGATARKALGETRRLVGVLQDDAAPGYAPQATVSEIPALVAAVEAAGFPTRLDVHGDRSLHPQLSERAQMAAYRIVQESLTNVMKHAGTGAHVNVVLTDVPTGLDILVSDDGLGPVAPDGLGHGLIGMRERALSVGGSFDAHPNPHGGFTVHATIPAQGDDE